MTRATKRRCGWARGELDVRYHDEEWGVPLHDDRTLFELLILEGAQAGLSWSTILQRREGYRTVFDDFDPAKVARYDAARRRRLLGDARIIRASAAPRSLVSVGKELPNRHEAEVEGSPALSHAVMPPVTL